MTATEPRPVSLPLMMGLVALPMLFVWLLLRRGYSRSLRRVAFGYAFAFPVLALISLFAEIAVTGEVPYR